MVKVSVLLSAHAMVEVEASEEELTDLLLSPALEAQLCVLKAAARTVSKRCSASKTLLGVTTRNCVPCARCGRWTSDPELPHFIWGLSPGSRRDDGLVCDGCVDDEASGTRVASDDPLPATELASKVNNGPEEA